MIPTCSSTMPTPWNLLRIIITAYNYARFLPEAVRSCLAQTYQPVEIIVVDDGSTDNTREVVAGFPEVKYIYQPNQGVTSALNVGLSHAQGEFIQFLDADDTLSPTKIQRCVEEFHTHPEAGLVYTDYLICTADMQPARKRKRRGIMPQGAGPHALVPIVYPLNPYFTNHCPLVRRPDLEAGGGFNAKLKKAHDWFMWVPVAGAGGSLCLFFFLLV